MIVRIIVIAVAIPLIFSTAFLLACSWGAFMEWLADKPEDLS